MSRNVKRKPFLNGLFIKKIGKKKNELSQTEIIRKQINS